MLNIKGKIEQTSNILVERNLNDEKAEKETLKIMDENIKKYGDNVTNYINSKMLLTAPKDFFYKYDNPVKTAVSNLQRMLSQSGNSQIIQEAKANRANPKLRKNSFEELSSAYLNYTDSDVNGRALVKKFATKVEQKILKALVMNELVGLGPLEPLWQDTKITEIICNGPSDIQVEINGNIVPVKSCHFRDAEHLQNLIDVLYSSINKSITVNNPMERGRLSDNSRMMAIHKSVAPDGPNFNIRRHSEAYWGPSKVIETNEASPELMNYLGNLIYDGVSFLVVGGTGTGKTTLLDALTAYYRPNERIITLEDNLEMKPHPRKLLAAPMECVPSKPGSKSAGITMRDLVHASLQMRPEAIVIGEVTDGAAFDLCQALNTGHSGASTLHTNSAKDAMPRLMALVAQSGLVAGNETWNLIATAFDIVITVERFPQDGSRKITEVSEVGNEVVANKDGEYTLPVRPLWKFIADSEKTKETKKVTGTWEQVGELSQYTKDKHHLDLKKTLSDDDLKEITKL